MKLETTVSLPFRVYSINKFNVIPFRIELTQVYLVQRNKYTNFLIHFIYINLQVLRNIELTSYFFKYYVEITERKLTITF